MKRLLFAFLNSVRGLRWAINHEAAVLEEMIVLIIALPLASFLAKDLPMFIALVGAVLFLIAVELLNTGLEKLADHVTRERHPQIGLVKDLGSAAVFMAILLNVMVWGAAIYMRM